MRVFSAAIQRAIVLLTILPAFLGAMILPAIAQQPPPSPLPTAANLTAGTLFGSREIVLTVLLLVFGIIIIFIEYLLLRKRTSDKIEDLAKFLIITLIIIGTLVLVGAGYGAEQIAPVIGLFGTVAGYLLGRHSADTAQDASSDKPPPAQESPNAGPVPPQKAE